MIEVGTVIYNILADDAGVGAQVANRIYPAPAPQGVTVPYVTYQVISVEPHDTKSGVSTVDRFRVQVDTWARNASDAATISAAIRTALDRYTPGAVSGVTVDGIRFDTERTDYEQDTDLRRKSADYNIRIKY